MGWVSKHLQTEHPELTHKQAMADALTAYKLKPVVVVEKI